MSDFFSKISHSNLNRKRIIGLIGFDKNLTSNPGDVGVPFQA